MDFDDSPPPQLTDEQRAANRKKSREISRAHLEEKRAEGWPLSEVEERFLATTGTPNRDVGAAVGGGSAGFAAEFDGDWLNRSGGTSAGRGGSVRRPAPISWAQPGADNAPPPSPLFRDPPPAPAKELTWRGGTAPTTSPLKLWLVCADFVCDSQGNIHQIALSPASTVQSMSSFKDGDGERIGFSATTQAKGKEVYGPLKALRFIKEHARCRLEALSFDKDKNVSKVPKELCHCTDLTCVLLFGKPSHSAMRKAVKDLKGTLDISCTNAVLLSGNAAISCSHSSQSSDRASDHDVSERDPVVDSSGGSKVFVHLVVAGRIVKPGAKNGGGAKANSKATEKSSVGKRPGGDGDDSDEGEEGGGGRKTKAAKFSLINSDGEFDIDNLHFISLEAKDRISNKHGALKAGGDFRKNIIDNLQNADASRKIFALRKLKEKMTEVWNAPCKSGSWQYQLQELFGRMTPAAADVWASAALSGDYGASNGGDITFTVGDTQCYQHLPFVFIRDEDSKNDKWVLSQPYATVDESSEKEDEEEEEGQDDRWEFSEKDIFTVFLVEDFENKFKEHGSELPIDRNEISPYFVEKVAPHMRPMQSSNNNTTGGSSGVAPSSLAAARELGAYIGRASREDSFSRPMLGQELECVYDVSKAGKLSPALLERAQEKLIDTFAWRTG